MGVHIMKKEEKTLSVPECAALCGVCRATINNWINTKKLYARRSGKNYSISVGEILFFLKSKGRDIPDELKNDYFQGQIYRGFQHCWEYWKGYDQGQNCKTCIVFLNKLDVCFTVKTSSRFHCETKCYECQYYLETYLPRIHFIHQIDLPAAIYMDLYFWSGNSSWAYLCEVQAKDLIGMGIEKIIYPDSLPIMISNIKYRALGNPEVPKSHSIFLNNSKHGKLKVKIAIYPLREPSGTNLLLAENEEE